MCGSLDSLRCWLTDWGCRDWAWSAGLRALEATLPPHASVQTAAPVCLPPCSNEFVRSDQLLSWIVAHVTPSPGSASTLRSGASNATAATVAPATPPAAVALAPGVPAFGAPLSRHRHSSSSSEVQSPKIADIQPFELSFWDLTMERTIGRGSFGKGKPGLLMCEGAAAACGMCTAWVSVVWRVLAAWRAFVQPAILPWFGNRLPTPFTACSVSCKLA